MAFPPWWANRIALEIPLVFVLGAHAHSGSATTGISSFVIRAELIASVEKSGE
jgi:hypothetical protein